MIPLKLKLSNFTSYGEKPPELDFSKFQMAAISGQNGVGKSSLLDAISWAIWGSSRAGDSADSLIKLGQNLMKVEFEFELDKQSYRVSRVRKLNSQTQLEFWSNTHNLTEGTIKSTQQKIINTLHLTYDTFVNSSYIRQGRADEFTTKGATERKKILADILGLSQYDNLEEKAKEKIKEIQTRLQLFDYQLLELEAELSMKDVRELEVITAKTEAEAAEKQLIEIEREIREVDREKELVLTKFESLKDKARRIETAKIDLLNLKVQIDVKQKAKEENSEILKRSSEIEENCQKLALLDQQKLDLESKRSELIKIKDEWAQILKILNERKYKRDSEVNKLLIQIKELKTQNDERQLQNDQLIKRKDICPTCGGVIGEEKNKQLIIDNNKFTSENDLKIKELDETKSKYENFAFKEEVEAKEKELEAKKIEEKTSEYSEVVKLISHLRIYEDLNLKLKEASSSIKAHEEAILDLQKIYDSQLETIKKDEADLELLQAYQNQFKEIEKRVEAKLILKQEQASIASYARSKLGAAEQLMSRTTQLEKVLDEKKSEQSRLRKDKEIYEELSLAFGKKGIQAMIIETAIPEIELETNNLLDRLTDGRMKVTLETQKETKTKTASGEKGIVETLDIIISDEMGERNYEMYSGGEAFRVNLALRLALSKLLTHRAGAKLQFLIIDEGFGTQDTNGISRIVEALATIKDDFAKILIITHLDELKEEFETRIEVSKGATGSTFELVGA